MLLPIVPLQAASLLNNQNAPAAGADRDDHDACAGYGSQFSTMQTGSVATNGAKTFSNGIRIIGEFTQPAGVDRVSVERALGVPSAVEALTEGGTKLVYKLDGCVGEI